MIQCDEVFDILTRGPFPTGAPSDGVVELHLTHCESCRRLAEALRPAIELFQEAVQPEESRNLPSYWGESGSNLAPWLTDGDKAVSRVAQRSRTSRRHDRTTAMLPRWSLPPMLRVAAAAVLGMALAGMLRRLASDDLPPEAPRALAAAGPARWRLPADPRRWSTEMNLHRACSAEVPGVMLVASLAGSERIAESFRQACCTACHAAGSQHARKDGPQTAARVAKACLACHSE